MNYDKPFITYEAMIQQMRSRGIIVSDEAFAMHALDSVSYYTLVNGYNDLFLADSETESFSAGTRFEDLYALHVLDMDFGSIVLKYILHFETTLKSRMSYFVSSRYGVTEDDYLEPQNYNLTKNRNRVHHVTNYLKRAAHNPNTRNSSLLHYQQKHNHIPPWILVNVLTIGNMQKWYEIMTNRDKNALCSLFLPSKDPNYSTEKDFFLSSIKLIRNFRNAAAHGRPTCAALSKYQLPKGYLIKHSDGIVTPKDFEHNPYARSGMYGVLAALYILLPDKFLRYVLIMDLLNELKMHQNIKIHGKSIPETFHLPDSFHDRLIRLLPKEYAKNL